MAFCSTREIPQQVFQYWWQQQGDWVEEPNARRGGKSGVQRLLDETGVLYAKKQIGHIYRSLLHPQGRPTVLRERSALLALDALGVPVPKLIYCGVERDPQQGWRGLLVTAELEGFMDIQSWYAKAAAKPVAKPYTPSCCNLLARLWRACTWGAGSTVACMPNMSSLTLPAKRRRLPCWIWRKAVAA